MMLFLRGYDNSLSNGYDNSYSNRSCGSFSRVPDRGFFGMWKYLWRSFSRSGNLTECYNSRSKSRMGIYSHSHSRKS